MRRSELDPDPLAQFEAWFSAAREAGVHVPETMTLATASREGRPSARQVLLKEFDERGFVFYSGYDSRKGRELAENPHATLLFHWVELGRQVRVEGQVDRVARSESEAYWATRPMASRLSAAASRQSHVVGSRGDLEGRVGELRSSGVPVPLPAHWGGYRLKADAYEFWEHRDDRLHDRFRYLPAETGWTIERLTP